MVFKKCEFCAFKTESSLAMSYHLETPHVKNYVYKCNFCPHETRSPHDILYHMEAEHMVRGRLERALSFHQCPNCPFEENQKGKLSRHLMACSRKYKPERSVKLFDILFSSVLQYFLLQRLQFVKHQYLYKHNYKTLNDA